MHYKLSGVKNSQVEVRYEQASKWKTVNNGTLFTRPSPVSYEHPLGPQIVCQPIIFYAVFKMFSFWPYCALPKLAMAAVLSNSILSLTCSNSKTYYNMINWTISYSSISREVTGSLVLSMTSHLSGDISLLKEIQKEHLLSSLPYTVEY